MEFGGIGIYLSRLLLQMHWKKGLVWLNQPLGFLE
jgi:hypothetical protein